MFKTFSRLHSSSSYIVCDSRIYFSLYALWETKTASRSMSFPGWKWESTGRQRLGLIPLSISMHPLSCSEATYSFLRQEVLKMIIWLNRSNTNIFSHFQTFDFMWICGLYGIVAAPTFETWLNELFYTAFIIRVKQTDKRMNVSWLGALAKIKYCMCKGTLTWAINLPFSQGAWSWLSNHWKHRESSSSRLQQLPDAAYPFSVDLIF